MNKRIFIKSFTPKKFRRFQLDDWQDKKSKIGKKITIISGQNGIGKSSLMSSLASCSGIRKKRLIKSGKGNNNLNKFQPSFGDFFKVDEKNEKYMDYDFIVDFITDEKFEFSKKVSFTNYHDRGIRLIPRTQKLKTVRTASESYKIVNDMTGTPRDGRIKMPTIYISLSRLLPIGETSISAGDQIRSMNKDLRKTLNDDYIHWYNEVLSGSILDSQKDTEIDSFTKESTSLSRFYVPMENNSKVSQSVGQDNLGYIISTLLEFKYLSQTDNDYNGGILYIDEIDATLHPEAQVKLINLLDRLSEELSLQVIATSHSLTMLSEVMEKRKSNNEDYEVIYFRDLNDPHQANFKSMYEIKADLYNLIEADTPILNIYLEDDITKNVFSLLIKAAKELNFPFSVSKAHYKLHSVFMGKNQIKKIVKNNIPLFENGLAILDGDAKFKDDTANNMWDNETIELYENNHDCFKKKYKEIANLERIFKGKIVALPDTAFPELFMHNILNIMVNDTKTYSDFWKHVEDEMINYEYLPSSGQLKQDYLHLPNEDTKDNKSFKASLHDSEKIKYIINKFARKTNMLFYYYKVPENTSMLKEWIDELNDKADKIVQKMKSNKFK